MNIAIVHTPSPGLRLDAKVIAGALSNALANRDARIDIVIFIALGPERRQQMGCAARNRFIDENIAFNQNIKSIFSSSF